MVFGVIGLAGPFALRHVEVENGPDAERVIALNQLMGVLTVQDYLKHKHFYAGLLRAQVNYSLRLGNGCRQVTTKLQCLTKLHTCLSWLLLLSDNQVKSLGELVNIFVENEIFSITTILELR